MKPIRSCLSLFALAAVQAATAATVVFTSDTIIAPDDASYENIDVVVSNCVLTVDGPHTFASARVAGNGVLTHTASANGQIPALVNVTNEAQVLTGTNAVTLGGNENVVLASVVVTDSSGTIIYTNGADYLVSPGPGTLTSLQRTDVSTIPDGGLVLVSYTYMGSISSGLILNVTGDLEVEPAAKVDLNGRGFGGRLGPGAGNQAGNTPSGSGAGYGGYGGTSSSNATPGTAYGSPSQPNQLGSGGGFGALGVTGPGGPGGGMARLTLSGNLILNGAILANGANATNSRSGGGSGGSIWIKAQLVTGDGTLMGNGGAGEPIHGGGGGGGRIALEFATNTFTGSIAAFGGPGWQRGGAGTIFTRTNGTPGLVTFDNGGNPGGQTLLQFSSPANLTIQGRAVAVVPSPQTVNHLVIRTNCSLVTSATNNAILTLTVAGNATIESGASIPLDGRGSPQNNGQGVGQPGNNSVGGGAGHGGFGGSGQSPVATAAGGNPYDNVTAPNTFGSGGRSVTAFNGGAGGGALRMTVSGELHLDGKISADATAGTGASGGGSGGSIWLTLGGLSGLGTISVNGGAGGLPFGGGGAGGRIAVTYLSNSFVGTFSANGANGAVPGGAGTIYTKANTAPSGNLTLDNGGLRGANTILDSTSLLILKITGGAAATSSIPSITLTNLAIGSNSSWLSGNSGGLTLNVNGSGSIAASGVLSADGAGQTGSGSGIASTSGSSGGGNGGAGGSGPTVPGGGILGTAAQPTSAGGRGGATQNNGVPGGGAFRMTVTGRLTVDGRITANGLTLSSNNNGGGAGGSIWLTLGGLAGGGAITADGGSGHLPLGGGGGGGRIAVYYTSNSFTGTYSARGGPGFGNGGAGTTYLKGSEATGGGLPIFIADNGGLPGTNTGFDSSLFNLLELRVLGGAYLTSTISGTLSVSNLTIGSNSTLLSLSSGLRMSVSGNATIAGVLSSIGFSTGSGSGQTSTLGSGGGGHGGAGGRGAGASGGSAFDSSANPSLGGATGGGTPSVLGGGFLQMTVTKRLTVDGMISVNGSNGQTNGFLGGAGSGGGGGGGIMLTVGGLAGAGTISADGGAGGLPSNGGGGGGRIAVFYTSNSFSGTYSARGGIGFANGGAGTVYLKAFFSSFPTFIADNGGLPGATTPLDISSSLLDLRVLGGAVLTNNFSTVTTSNLTIGANSTLSSAFSTLNLNVSGAATVSGAISLDGTSTSSQGVGQISGSGSGGGAHGGYGGRGLGALGGGAFDSITSPISGGGRGASSSGLSVNGGGLLQMTVSGPLALNGRISASGFSGQTNISGAAGGGIVLTVGGLSGSGVIAADGGAGGLPSNGGGGGGRIAVYYTSNTFAGTYSAKGGAGFASGGAGTVYLKASTNQQGRLLVDNGGLVPGTNTLWDSSAPSLSDVTITGGSMVVASLNSISLANLTVTGNSLLFGPPNLTVTSNATVGAGAAISLDGANTFSSSTGNGGISSVGSGGGANAGYGGSGFGAPGGNAFGLASSPTALGGRGGSTSGSGGPGGGAMRMTVNGILRVDGRISADGLNISSNNSGGGAGGSLWFTVGTLSGGGLLSANGGSGHLPAGGGGGGGRVAITYTSNLFSGVLSAVGGAGFVRGGAGTIYTTSQKEQRARILVDNGGIRGTNTFVSAVTTYDLTVQGGAIASTIGIPFDVLVHSNGWISQLGLITVNHNVTFDAGGGLTVDGLGNDQSGAGFISQTQAGGGGHGGYGGRHTAFSGLAYDSIKNPVRGGGIGGNGSGTSTAPLGGTGGGAVHLNVLSTLQLDGAITSSGKDGDINSGGGAGGSVWLSAGIFSGTGTVSAQGGNGNGSGGGGGGGRVAIFYNSKSFSGTLSACGGNGFEAGGAGTIYLRTNSQPEGQLVLNNCEQSGAATPLLQSFGLPSVLQVGGGAVGEFQGTLPVMSNIVIAAGGGLRGYASDPGVNLIVLGNLTIQAGGAFALDGEGFGPGNGPGFGHSLFYIGAGGGYGGVGGAASSGAAGGVTNGSATQPIDRGSGGGFGSGLGPLLGSAGGGALRLTVSGLLTVDGVLTANGTDGFQDDSGGGSGGSIWVMARTLAGAGAITAGGGAGEPYNGGGGGGGRIALYLRTNAFSGQVLAEGGPGASPGGSGTVLITNIPLPTVVAQNPFDVVSYAVSNVDLTFSTLMNGITAEPADFALATPDGLVPQSDFTVSALDLSNIRVSFPSLDTIGYYEIHAGPGIEDVFGQSMAGAYIGSFLIFPPTISGHVTDTNGSPVAFVTMRPAPDLLPVVTDSHGAYALEVVPGWSGTITPSKGTGNFIPSARTYANVGSDLTNENYVLASVAPFTLNIEQQGPNLKLSYLGVGGVNYQMQCSTNLVDWMSYGAPVAGTNGIIELMVPNTGEPLKFFRFKADP